MRFARRSFRAALGAAAVAALLTLVALPASTVADPSCTDTWTGDAGTEAWQTAANWSTDSVPGSGDVVCIGVGTTVQITGGTNQVGSLQDEGSLEISGGSLELTGSSEATSVVSLTLSGGSLTGAGELDVSDAFSWTGGSMSGSGKTVLETGASSTIDPGSGSSVSLSRRELVNQGTLTWSSGSVEGRESAEIDNGGTFAANADVSGSEWPEHGLLNSDGSNVWLYNTGTVKKTAGSLFTSIQWQIDNEGIVEAKTGQLILAGGNHGSTVQEGSWAGLEGGGLAFSGGSYDLGSDVEMSGSIFLVGGNIDAGDIQGPDATLWLWYGGGSTLTLTSTSTASHLGTLNVESSTTLTGPGAMDVSGSFSWGGGAMSGSGSTILGTGATGAIEPGSGNAVSLTERDLVNQGTLTFSSGSVEGRSNAEIDNSGTLEANADVSGSEWWEHGLLNSDGSNVWLHNTGVVKKAAGGLFTQIQFQMDNEGTVEVKTGQIILTGGNHGSTAEGGSWAGLEGGGMVFNAGSYILGSDVGMSGSVFLTGGNVQAGDIQALEATLWLWSGSATLTLTGTSTASHLGTFNLNSATTLTGAGTLDIASSFAWAGTMSGSGSTVLGPGATGTIEASSGCETMSLAERTLVNEGTLTFGSGTLLLSEGARFDNQGTFKDNSEASCYGPQIQSSGSGAAPSVLNTGAFEKTAGAGTSTVDVNFGNDGHVEAQTGELDFADGGISEQTATGSWSVLSGASIVLSAGKFPISEEVDLSSVLVTGATVERAPAPQPPSGSLNSLAYAAGTVSISGVGENHGLGFSSATLEVTPDGHDEWRSLCGPLTPSLSGEFSCFWNTATGLYPDGDYQLRAQLSDSESPPTATPTSAIAVLVDNTPPEGSLNSLPQPLSGTVSLEGQASDSGSGVASWTPQITPEGTSEWTDACPAQYTPASGTTYSCSLEVAEYPAGSYELRAVIADNAGNTYATAAQSTTIGQLAPSNISSPAISGMAQEGQTLTAGEGEWEGTPPITYTYQWQSCDSLGESCMDIVGATGASYRLQASDVGATVRVVVTAEDAGGSASSGSQPSAVVEVGPPVNRAAPTISGTAQDGQTLTASEGEWESTPPLAYAYQWESCNATGGECEDIAGATAASYVLGDADVGGSVRVLVTADNAAGTVSAVSVASARVAPVVPVNDDLPSIAGSPVQGQTLSASPGVWSGAPAPGYAFQWERCDAYGEACSDIAGATGVTYQLGAVDVGATVQVRVVATNAASSATASSSVTALVEGTGATAPSNTAPPTISGSPEDGQTLSASAGSWEGTSPISYTYLWQSCNEAGSACEPIEGATGASYTLGATDEQTRLRVLVTASGPGGHAQAVSEASATIQAGAPSELEAPSISGSPSVGEALYAETGAWGGSEVRFSYQWERCNEAGAECQQIPGAGEAEYIPAEGDAASALRVRIGASNAAGSVTALSPASTPVQSADVLLNTAAPTVSGEPVSGGTLSANPGGWLGSDAISYTYEWQRCDLYGAECENIEGAGESTYSPLTADVGHTLRVRVSASELEGAASEISTTTAPIAAPGAPVVEAPPSIAGTGLVGYTLTATAGAWSGEEGRIDYSYQWERCGEAGAPCSAIVGATEGSYTLTEADAGFAIRALVSASDTGGSSEAVSAPIIATAQGVADVAPPQVSGDDQLGHPLQASTGIWTGSGAIAFSYEWQRCDAAGESCATIPGADEASYSPTEADAGHALRVTNTATGPEGSASATSPATPSIGSEATAPENTVLPSIEGQLTAGETLSATTGSWSGSESITYAYQWQSCNQLGAACVEIGGATSDTYTLTEADIGSTIRVIAHASNGAGSASATSQASETVGAAGPPANTQAPAIIGQATEGQRLFAENGGWSGSKPLTFYYRWERCNAAGEDCAAIEGATKPSYALTATDVGSTVRVNVTATNGLGSAGSISTQTETVVSATQAGASAALEAIENADPSLLARSSAATIEEQSLTPTITDSGEELSSQSTLASSTISKAIPGEFSVETFDGQLSLTPLQPSSDAATMPTIANGAAALFAETWHESDTIVRPSALGVIALLQLRSQHAPTSVSWEVGIGPDQQLQRLPDGSVAIVEPTPEASLEAPPGEETPAPGASEASPQQAGEGVGGHAGEEELDGSLAEEGGLTPLAAASTVSTPEAAVKEHELHPGDTQARYEKDTSAMAYAETHTNDTALMVIEPPTVLDAAGNAVPASLAVEGDTVTLTVTPEPEASYPITAEIASAAPTDPVSVARDPVKYGLSDPKAPVFEHLDSGLTEAPLKIKVARDVVPYYAWQEETSRKDLRAWLKAVGKHPYLKPYITVEAGSHKSVGYSEYKADVSELIKELMNGEKSEGIPPVKLWGAWNEPDLQEDGLPGGSKEAALLWKIADAVGVQLHCGCKVAAGEFHAYSNYIKKYIETIINNNSYTTAKPHVWGFHDYYDPEKAQKHAEEHLGNTDLEKDLKEIKGRLPKARIWISETGVLLQNEVDATKLKTSTEHAKLQVNAANDVLKLAQGHSRIELINYYLDEGPTAKYEDESKKFHAFDSALVAGAGIAEAQKPRESYCVLVLDKKKGCSATGHTGAVARESVTTAAATMTASVDPFGLPTTYLFQYGTTTAYGQTTSVTSLSSETGEQTTTAAVEDLEPCTTYHYQVEAENEANEGAVSLGGDQTFTTSCQDIITAFAGNGERDRRSGDGGKATEASIATINGLAVAADGDVYLSEFIFNDVRKIEPDGIITDAAGIPEPGSPHYSGDGELATSARLGEPAGLATSEDTVYIADEKNQVVRAFSPNGLISTFAGDRPEVNYESGPCPGARDRLYSGDGGPASSAGFGDPTAVAAGPDGSLYIADRNDDVVRKVAPDGTITTVAGYYESSAEKTHKIYKFGEPERVACEYGSYEPPFHTLSGVGGPATSATLGQMNAIAAGPEGELYIALADNLVLKVEADGTLTDFAGTGEAGYSGDGGPATFATLDDPAGLAVGADGSVYIADSCNAVVRRVAPDGIITTVAGNGERGEGGDGGPATEAQLEDPGSIAVDSSDNLYIGSNESRRVRKIDAPLGSGTTNDVGGDTCPSEEGGGAS